MSLEDIQALVVPGRFLRLWCPFTRPPKTKYYLVVATKPAIGFLVNTNPTQFQRERPHLMAENIPMAVGGFVTHACYLDCTSAISDLEIEEIFAQIDDDPSRISDMATAELIERIKAVVGESLMIEKNNRRIILRNLEACFPSSS